LSRKIFFSFTKRCVKEFLTHYTWIEARVRRAVAEVDPNLPVRRVATLAARIDDNLALGRLLVYLTSAFGFLALTLVCVGLYGVMSYAVARRTAELGIRMALGAPDRTFFGWYCGSRWRWL
jgi:ABC-type antimicrobial peptide transport system permease subunit